MQIRKFKDLASPVSTKIVKKSIRFRTVFCQFIRLYKDKHFLHHDVQRKLRNSGSWRDRWIADSSIPWRSARKRSYPAGKLAALGYVVAREKGAWDRGRWRKLQSSLFRAGPRDEHEHHVPFHISLFVLFFTALRTYVRGPTKIRLVVGHRRKSTGNRTCRDLSRMLARSFHCDLSRYGEHFTRKMQFLHGDCRKFVRLIALEYRNQRQGSLKIT